MLADRALVAGPVSALRRHCDDGALLAGCNAGQASVMSIFDPKETGSDEESAGDRKRADAPLPTRFGRDRHRRRPTQDPATRAPRATEGPLSGRDDDQPPFEDDGNL